jgi:hypothetical protein
MPTYPQTIDIIPPKPDEPVADVPIYKLAEDIYALKVLIGVEDSEDPDSLVYKVANASAGTQGPKGDKGDTGAASTVPGPKGDTGNTGAPGTTDYTQLQNIPTTFTPAAHNQAISTVTSLQTALDGKEAANSNIQTHVTSAHAPANAQKNSDITKAEIEAKLTGAITTHSHAQTGQPIGFAILSNDTLAQALATNINTRVTVTAARTLTTTVPAAGVRSTVEILTAGSASFVVTFGTGFKPTATVATGTTASRIWSVSFMSDGTYLHETGRSAVMVA